MNQTLIESFTLLSIYLFLMSVGYLILRKINKYRQNQETPIQDEKKYETIQENYLKQNQETQSHLINTLHYEQAGLLDLYLFSNQECKQNIKDCNNFQYVGTHLIKLGQFIYYISNNLMIVSIMNAYYGIDEFHKSCWLLGLLIVPIYNLFQTLFILAAYLISQKILEQKKIEYLEVRFILVSYLFFQIANLAIIFFINGDDNLIDKAFSVSGISFIFEIILKNQQPYLDLNIVQKLNQFLTKS